MSLKPCPYRQVDDEGHILCGKIKHGDREVSPNVCRACPVSAINCAHLRATLDHQARPPITVRYGNGKTEVWEDDVPAIALASAACAVKVIPILAPRDCSGCPLRQALIAPDAIATMPVSAAAEVRPPVADPPTPAAAPTSAPARRTATQSPRPGRAAPPAPAIAAAQAHATGPAQRTSPRSASSTGAAPVATGPAHAAAVAEQRRSSIVAQKIIKLQEWLEKQKSAPSPAPLDSEAEPDRLPRRAAAAPMPANAPALPPPRLEEKRVGWTD